jgi:quercetin dioxygenase-like cupin family protein
MRRWSLHRSSFCNLELDVAAAKRRRARAALEAFTARGVPPVVALALLLGGLLAGVVLGMAQKTESPPKILLENKHVRVREVKIEPGVPYPPHTHQYPHVGVIVRGGKLEFTEKGKSETVDFKDGDAGWREAGVTHSVRHPGQATVHVVEVELK